MTILVSFWYICAPNYVQVQLSVVLLNGYLGSYFIQPVIQLYAIFLRMVIFILMPLLCWPWPLSALTLWGEIGIGGGSEGGVGLIPLGCRCDCHSPWDVFNSPTRVAAISEEVGMWNFLWLKSSQNSLHRCQFLQRMWPWTVERTVPTRMVR